MARSLCAVLALALLAACGPATTVPVKCPPPTPMTMQDTTGSSGGWVVTVQITTSTNARCAKR